MPLADRRSFVRKLLAWGRENRRDFPWRDESDPFRVLVAEVLLQRSRSKTVAAVYKELFSRWPDATALAEAQTGEIEDVIRPLGLVRRASLLRTMAQEVKERGEVPRSVAEMTQLAGVGRYAASATSAAAFKRRTATVDGTSARVYRRYFGSEGAKDSHVDEELWELVEETLPSKATQEWNWAVLDLAALICLPKLPRCPECPLNRDCVVGAERIQISVAGSG